METGRAPSCLPPPRRDQIYVVVHPIDSGQITLPERYFLSPSDPIARVTVPSLSFLVAHPSAILPRYLLFELGLRSQLERYLPAQQAHLTILFLTGWVWGLRSICATGFGSGHRRHRHSQPGPLRPPRRRPGVFRKSRFIFEAGSLSLLHRGLEGTSTYAGLLTQSSSVLWRAAAALYTSCWMLRLLPHKYRWSLFPRRWASWGTGLSI
ncbi:hypothetical protein ASPFODRAFT_222943 [Aspergillus luchuensis CBS 106.47]|uniref:Uncharacterized protein n=1 Tax=Aspergillus luchuensis (strain CBS 106.47) TaxID=1137211 RepID=A0A1M3T3I9_ASPLC|nr:hypothetical protein ASPFODRAFT_222943 [Aspergillus luchuensis CBS 106.47]